MVPKYSVCLGSLEKEEPISYDNKVSENRVESKRAGPVESNRLIVRIDSKGDSANSLRHCKKEKEIKDKARERNNVNSYYT